MPRILVVTDEGTRHRRVLMDEQVIPEHLNDEFSAVQVLERLAWGIEDAARAERRPRRRLRNAVE